MRHAHRRDTAYICDLDGTLLRSDGVLSDFAKDGLNELLSAGTRITVASSRATPAMRALLMGVNLRLPVIEFNGAFVSDLESGTNWVPIRRRSPGVRLRRWNLWT
jgi:hydroxymethylpyrimidine pyrophosphatase-like HAD family hydrolase